MKVILTEDVQGLGSIGDVTDVAQGYASNFLIPRKLAVPATAGNLKHWDEKRAWIVKREAANRAEAEGLAAKIEGATLKIIAKAGEEGRLYGSVTVKDIAARILEDVKVEVDRKKILLPEPIKTAGEHKATVRIFKDIDATVTIDVVGELEEGEAPPIEDLVEKMPEQLMETKSEASEAPEDAAAADDSEPTDDAEGSEPTDDSAKEEAAGGAADQPKT